jgi:hypothetical protein
MDETSPAESHEGGLSEAQYTGKQRGTMRVWLTQANIVRLAFLPPTSGLIVAQIDYCACDFVWNLNVKD